MKKPSLALIPSGYKAGKVYSILPNNNVGDFTFIRNSGATRVNKDGLIEDVNADVPRLDYSDAGCPSLLLEPQRINSLPYSEDFTQWTVQSGTTITSNTTETLSPSGQYNASKIVSNGSNGFYKIVSVTGVVSRSIYLKSVTGTVNVKLKDPAATVTTKTLSVNENWQRFELVESNGNPTSGLWIDDIPSSGIYAFGAQLEQGSYTTSYIPTNGSIATRNIEECEDSGDADVFNDDEGVLYAQIGVKVDNGFIALNDGSTSNRVSMFFNETNKTIRAIVSSGGGSQMDTTYTSPTSISDNVKVAMKYKENDFALWVNGVEVLTDSSGLTPTGLDRFDFSINGILPFYGKCKEVKYYDKALTDAELTELTTL